MSENLPMKPDDIKIGQIVKAVRIYDDGTVTTITGKVRNIEHEWLENYWLLIGAQCSEEFHLGEQGTYLSYVYLIQDVSSD